MARTYYLSNTNSDLSGGADFNKAYATTTGTLATLAVSVAINTTETSYGFTAAGEPGTNGATGNYTVELDVQTANTLVFCAVSLSRVNSAGTVQSTSTATTEQSLSVGTKIFTLSAVNLGTWASGDRLRVNFALRNSSTMTAQSVTLGFATANSQMDTPFLNTITGTASGTSLSTGQATIAPLDITASGTSTSTGAGNAIPIYRITASGTSASSGSASGIIPSSAIQATASGTSASTGSAAGFLSPTLSITGSGTSLSSGAAAGGLNTRASASGTSLSSGSVNGLVYKFATASGTSASTGSGAIRLQLALTATSLSTSSGSGTMFQIRAAKASGTATSTGQASIRQTKPRQGWGVLI